MRWAIHASEHIAAPSKGLRMIEQLRALRLTQAAGPRRFRCERIRTRHHAVGSERNPAAGQRGPVS